MAISAGRLWIVVRLISMAAGTNLPLGSLPLMRNMTSRTVGGGVCRLKMQLCAVRMTGSTGGDRLKVLLLKMTS